VKFPARRFRFVVLNVTSLRWGIPWGCYNIAMALSRSKGGRAVFLSFPPPPGYENDMIASVYKYRAEVSVERRRSVVRNNRGNVTGPIPSRVSDPAHPAPAPAPEKIDLVYSAPGSVKRVRTNMV
jgi:hypothetical protein